MEEPVSSTQTIECSHCGQHILVEDSFAGMTVNCPTCDGEILIPSKSPPPIPMDGLLQVHEESEVSDLPPRPEWTEAANTTQSTVGYFISIVVRLVWSLTLGVFLFFPLALLLFIILDIFMPNSNSGYRTLVNICKWGSCHWFKGVNFQMETDDFEVRVEKERQRKP